MIRYSIDNKACLTKADTCGCFYCQKIFNPEEIKKWTDNGKTAICPHCGVDSIIAETNEIKITPELLEELNKKYFKKVEK